MSAPVPFSEAVEILRRMIDAPDQVRALQVVDAGTYGPLPFFVPRTDGEAEVTLAFSGGVITGAISIRVGDRFSSCHAWHGEEGGNPFDELSDAETELFGLSLISAAG